MICSNCNQKLPDDSEFCQYCGIKILNEDNAQIISSKELQDSITGELQVKAQNGELTYDDVIKLIVVDNVEEIINDNDILLEERDISENNTIVEDSNIYVDRSEVADINQNTNDEEDNFGLVPENPIYTLKSEGMDGEIKYLDNLYVSNNHEKIKWEHRGSTSCEHVEGMIDIYDIYFPSGKFYKTLYINMNGSSQSISAPAGFITHYFSQENHNEPKEKKRKVKFCSSCGAIIDDNTKKCTGCQKQYFKGIKFNKFILVIGAFITILAIFLGIIIYQHIKINNFEKNEINLNSQITKLNEQISGLNSQISDLKFSNWGDKMELDFYQEFAVLVNEGSKKYHTYYCEDFDSTSFWIYNINAAEQLGYYACPNCH